MAGDTPTIKLKKGKSKLSDSTAASRANSPTSSIAGDSITVKSRAFSPATGANTPIDETNTLCKHCKNHYNKLTDPNHSKLCLRAKQERQRKKREEKERAEAAAAAGITPATAANNTVKTEEGDQSMTLSTTNDSTKETTEIPTPTTSKSKKAATASTTEKKQTKKRKADTDTASLAGDINSTTTMKPPTKKQKKKDATTSTTSGTPVPDTASIRDTPAPGTKASTTGTSSKADKPSTSTAKPKAPVDVEKQCGVLLANGQMCARSLTCKSHAMGAKRSVPGRSLPYDILLAQYQKKNQAKLQKAAMERNAAEEREREGMEEGGEGGRVDSEEEVERVMNGLGRWAPKPLVEWGAGLGGGGVWGGVGRRTRGIRFREQLGEALKGHRGNNLFSVAPRGVQDGSVGTVVDASNDSVMDAEAARRMSDLQQQAHNRKASTIAVG